MQGGRGESVRGTLQTAARADALPGNVIQHWLHALCKFLHRGLCSGAGCGFHILRCLLALQIAGHRAHRDQNAFLDGHAHGVHAMASPLACRTLRRWTSAAEQSLNRPAIPRAARRPPQRRARWPPRYSSSWLAAGLKKSRRAQRTSSPSARCVARCAPLQQKPPGAAPASSQRAHHGGRI